MLIRSSCGFVRQDYRQTPLFILLRRSSSSKSGSSSRYLARQKRDPFVKARERSGTVAEGGLSYVSRSSFKLEQLNAAHKFLGRGKVVVDLGAAPGGWTQVALERGCKHVFALDLLPLHPSVLQQARMSDEEEGPGRLTVLQGDFRDREMHFRLQRSIAEVLPTVREGDRTVDVIVSDMMANTSGNRLRDSVASLDLLEAALQFAKQVLRSKATSGPPSILVLKYFNGPDAQEFRKTHLEPLFDRVQSKKVAASRSESSEMYFICSNLHDRS